MYSNFMFIDRLLFELSFKNTEARKPETQKHGNTHTNYDEYSIVAFCNYNYMSVLILKLSSCHKAETRAKLQKSSVYKD